MLKEALEEIDMAKRARYEVWLGWDGLQSVAEECIIWQHSVPVS